MQIFNSASALYEFSVIPRWHSRKSNLQDYQTCNMSKIIIRIIALLMGSFARVSFNTTRFFRDTSFNIAAEGLLTFVKQILFDSQLNHIFSDIDFDHAIIDPELRLDTLSDLPLSSSGYLYIQVSNKAHDNVCSLTIFR
jgi:hypothetical protein